MRGGVARPDDIIPTPGPHIFPVAGPLGGPVRVVEVGQAQGVAHFVTEYPDPHHLGLVALGLDHIVINDHPVQGQRPDPGAGQAPAVRPDIFIVPALLRAPALVDHHHHVHLAVAVVVVLRVINDGVGGQDGLPDQRCRPEIGHDIAVVIVSVRGGKPAPNPGGAGTDAECAVGDFLKKLLETARAGGFRGVGPEKQGLELSGGE